MFNFKIAVASAILALGACTGAHAQFALPSLPGVMNLLGGSGSSGSDLGGQQDALVRVGVTVNAKVYNVSKAIPSTQAAVGPVQFAGVGPDDATARGSALKLAATNAARELGSQLTAKGMR